MERAILPFDPPPLLRVLVRIVGIPIGLLFQDAIVKPLRWVQLGQPGVAIPTLLAVVPFVRFSGGRVLLIR